MELQKETITLKYTFTDEEKLDISNELASIIGEKSRVEMEKKEVMQEYNSRLQGLESEIQDRGRKVSNGYEMKRVECFVLVNADAGIKQYWTKDQDPDTDDPVKEELLPRGHQFGI